MWAFQGLKTGFVANAMQHSALKFPAMPVIARLLPFWLLLATTCLGGPPDEKQRPEVTVFQNVCVKCHGPKGHGSDQVKAPAIAGLPAWYLQRQLNNFRSGRRGSDPAEPQAMVMAALVKSLDASLLDKVVKHVESLPVAHPAPTSVLRQPDLALGKELFQERCMECHRFNASGELAFGSPPLLGQPDWYLLTQLTKFKDGRRGNLTNDEFGGKMVLSARFIESQEALHSVVAYILSLNPPATAGEAEVDTLFVAPLSADAAGKR